MTAYFSPTTWKKIDELCRKHKVQELSLFGSRVRGDANDLSDYDFLVVFAPEARITLFEFSRIQIDLSELIQAKVDLVPKDGVKPKMRKRALSEARIIYAA